MMTTTETLTPPPSPSQQRHHEVVGATVSGPSPRGEEKPTRYVEIGSRVVRRKERGNLRSSSCHCVLL